MIIKINYSTNIIILFFLAGPSVGRAQADEIVAISLDIREIFLGITSYSRSIHHQEAEFLFQETQNLWI